eukprot:2915379-Lingulodinium_polyedra.AAC.1
MGAASAAPMVGVSGPTGVAVATPQLAPSQVPAEEPETPVLEMPQDRPAAAEAPTAEEPPTPFPGGVMAEEQSLEPAPEEQPPSAEADVPMAD